MCITCLQRNEINAKIRDPSGKQSLCKAGDQQWEYVSSPWMTCERTIYESNRPSNYHNRFY